MRIVFRGRIAALNKEDMRDMTTAIICSRHPCELLKRLAREGSR
jgi:hypothetical protein